MTTFTTEDRIKATSQHYAVLSTSPKFREVLRFIEDNNLLYEAHLNRTRFWVTPEVRTEFESYLGGYCDFVPYDQNLMTGTWDTWKPNKDII
jgi:hypothetical protein